MSAEKLSKRYAKALFDEAQSNGSLETIFADLNLINTTLQSSKELTSVFKSPVIPGHKKQTIASEIFKSKISATTTHFLQLIIEQSREAFLQNIIAAFIQLYNEKKGIAQVTVTTATELDAANEAKIIRFIQSTSGNPNVKINKKVDPSIMGGFIIDFGGKLYDNSVRYKLSKIEKELSLN